MTISILQLLFIIILAILFFTTKNKSKKSFIALIFLLSLGMRGYFFDQGYKLTQSVNKNKENIEELKKELNRLQKEKKAQLKSRFPHGYQLFGILEKQIIPYKQPSSKKISIDWSTARILNITKDKITVRLPDAITPNQCIFEGNITIIKNQAGFAHTVGIVMGGYSPSVIVLKSEGNRIILALGYIKVKE